MLAFLCAALDQQRLAVVVTYRPDEARDLLGEWLADRRRARGVIEVALGPLSHDEIRGKLAACSAATRRRPWAPTWSRGSMPGPVGTRTSLKP